MWARCWRRVGYRHRLKICRNRVQAGVLPTAFSDLRNAIYSRMENMSGYSPTKVRLQMNPELSINIDLCHPFSEEVVEGPAESKGHVWIETEENDEIENSSGSNIMHSTSNCANENNCSNSDEKES